MIFAGSVLTDFIQNSYLGTVVFTEGGRKMAAQNSKSYFKVRGFCQLVIIKIHHWKIWNVNNSKTKAILLKG